MGDITMFDKVINDILSANGGEENDVIKALREKRDERSGEECSDEEIANAVKAILESEANEDEPEEEDEDDDEEEEEPLSDEEKQNMADVIAVIKEVLDEDELSYNTRKPREDIEVIEFGFTIKGIRLRVSIGIEARPNVCRLNCVLPIVADQTFDYPLCKFLNDESYSRRFGAFKYDQRDGELSYEYSFLINHGLHKDDFKIYFNAVIGSSLSCFDTLRRYSVGRFKKKELEELKKKIDYLFLN